MATIINKIAGKVSRKWIDLTSSKYINDNKYNLGLQNKAWRIYLRGKQMLSKNKATYNTSKADSEQVHEAKPGAQVPGGRTNKEVIDWANRHKNYQTNPVSTGDGTETLSYTPSIRSTLVDSVKNQIVIINYSVSPYQRIAIQGAPSRVEVQPISDWVAIKSMGRNNPFMMYTGGEDSIRFEVDWYVYKDQTRKEVIRKCRLLESWSRADGYTSAPPLLKIKWGNSGIYDEDFFVLTMANYTLSNFQNAHYKKIDEYQGGTVDLKLLPHCATQELEFKRVSGRNRTHLDIISQEDIDALLNTLPKVEVPVEVSVRNPSIAHSRSINL